MSVTYSQKCEKCGHCWQSRKPVVVACVSCKSYFNRKHVIKQPKPVVVKVIKRKELQE